MKRFIAVLGTAALVAVGLLSAAPAQAGPAAGAPVKTAADCRYANEWVWDTDTPFASDTCYQTPGGRFVMQGDGNLVLYRNNGRICESNTDGWWGASAYFQYDGNLVVSYYGYPLWASNTEGNYGAQLVMKRNGTVYIRDYWWNVVWVFC